MSKAKTEFNPQSMDATVWAKEFMRLYNNAMASQHDLWVDYDLMLGWFANAIMAGYDEGQRKAKSDLLALILERGPKRVKREGTRKLKLQFAYWNQACSDWERAVREVLK